MTDFPFTKSFWAPSEISPRNPLEALEIEADVAVVGGGYAGMSAAYYIKQAKPDTEVVLLEKEYIGFGPSGRNFGAVVPGLRELRAAFLSDTDPAEEAFAQAWYLEARRELERRISEGRIDCEYRSEPLLMQSLDEESWEAQKREAGFLAERGTPYRLLNRDEIQRAMDLPYEVFGGIVRTEWHAVQPYKLARGFGDQLRSHGVVVFEGTAVADIADDGARVSLRTVDGGIVRCRKAVLATNAYTTLLASYADVVFPRHTHVIATEVLDDDVFKSLGYHEYRFVEDAGLTFYYSRVYQNRLLFGGGASAHGLFARSTVDSRADQDIAEFERIYQEMERRFPQLRGVGVDAAWGGPIDMTESFMPIIAPMPDKPNVISSFGFSGDGLLNGSMSGKMVAGLILGPDYIDPAAERIRQYMARA